MGKTKVKQEVVIIKKRVKKPKKADKPKTTVKQKPPVENKEAHRC